MKKLLFGFMLLAGLSELAHAETWRGTMRMKVATCSENPLSGYTGTFRFTKKGKKYTTKDAGVKYSVVYSSKQWRFGFTQEISTGNAFCNYSRQYRCDLASNKRSCKFRYTESYSCSSGTSCASLYTGTLKKS